MSELHFQISRCGTSRWRPSDRDLGIFSSSRAAASSLAQLHFRNLTFGAQIDLSCDPGFIPIKYFSLIHM
jgi:hypothetical protein